MPGISAARYKFVEATVISALSSSRRNDGLTRATLILLLYNVRFEVRLVSPVLDNGVFLTQADYEEES